MREKWKTKAGVKQREKKLKEGEKGKNKKLKSEENGKLKSGNVGKVKNKSWKVKRKKRESKKNRK